jgi:hypothetical protein
MGLPRDGRIQQQFDLCRRTGTGKGPRTLAAKPFVATPCGGLIVPPSAVQ